MECSIEELFSEDEILNEEEGFINIFNKCKEDLNNKRIDFYSLKSSKAYREILCRYFKWKGYGYLSTQFKNSLNDISIDENLNINNSNFVKIAKLLNDSAIININKINISHGLEKNNLIRYKKNKGIDKEYLIKFKCEDIPFNIKNVSIQHKDIITYKVNNLNLKLKINIDENSEIEYNFTETILIYTDYGIYKLQFTIRCENEDIVNMPFKTLNDYINLYRENRDRAYKLFIDESFAKYLNQLENKIAWIKYNEALNLSKSLNKESNEDKFNLFLKLNGIYNEYGEISSYDSSMGENEKFNVQETSKDTINEVKENKARTLINNVNSENENNNYEDFIRMSGINIDDFNIGKYKETNIQETRKDNICEGKTNKNNEEVFLKSINSDNKNINDTDFRGERNNGFNTKEKSNNNIDEISEIMKGYRNGNPISEEKELIEIADKKDLKKSKSIFKKLVETITFWK